MFIPIRTETPIKQTPVVNIGLIVANMLVFAVTGLGLLGPRVVEYANAHFVFVSDGPTLFQFFSYQFLHGDGWHIFGNMVALWVFGNSVNAKMGQIPYLLFYLASGVLAAWGYAMVNDELFRLVGASGSIAGVTTAYLALFPRSRVLVLVFFVVFIYFLEIPAMLLIGISVVVFDLVLPRLSGGSNVAYGAHLVGYVVGFSFAMTMLLIRALPRDQFDMLALMKRWHQRRSLAAPFQGEKGRARQRFGTVARVEKVSPVAQAEAERALDQVTSLRSRIGEALAAGRPVEAAALYEELVMQDAAQCLSERQQLLVAREFYTSGKFVQAAAAFDRFLSCYAGSGEAPEIRLLAGIIYARDLHRPELADERLTAALTGLREDARREQCLGWLRRVRSALGRPSPDESNAE